MVLRLTIDLLAITTTAWFWPHCALPLLIYHRATLAAQWIVLGISALQIAAYAFLVVAEFVHFANPLRMLVLGIPGGLWVLGVGLGYLQGYALLRRVTGKGQPPNP